MWFSDAKSKPDQEKQYVLNGPAFHSARGALHCSWGEEKGGWS
jgi:hypothetical protein